MDELDGVNRLVFNGPFSAFLSDGRGTEIKADKIVIVSKNGSVAKIPVSQLRTIKERALCLYWDLVQSQKTICGAERVLREGAIPLWKDLYWLKSETAIRPIIVQKEEKPMSVQGLRKIAKEV